MPPRLLQSLKTGPVSIGVFRVGFPAGKSSRSMEASKLSDAQKAFIVKQGDDGVPVAGSCRKAGISQATYFNWRKKYAGLLPDEMGRLKALEDENSRLKQIVPDLILDREMFRDKSSAESSELPRIYRRPQLVRSRVYDKHDDEQILSRNPRPRRSNGGGQSWVGLSEQFRAFR